MVEYHAVPPLDTVKYRPVSIGSQTKTFWQTADTNGAWQAVTLPANTECKSALVTVHDGDDTEYDIDAGNVGFLYSSNSDGTGWSRIHPYGLEMSIGKIQAQDGGVIGYVKAETGNKVAVVALY